MKSFLIGLKAAPSKWGPRSCLGCALWSETVMGCKHGGTYETGCGNGIYVHEKDYDAHMANIIALKLTGELE